MVKQLLEEVRAGSLDEPSRERLAEIYERSIVELSEALSPDLQDELRNLALPFKDGVIPSDGELRVAKAQLVGWLEGLFHGIQATLFAQQIAARQQLEGMRQLRQGQWPAVPVGDRCRQAPSMSPIGLERTSKKPTKVANHIRVSRGPNATKKYCACGDSFTHLHVPTEFSMLDGAARLDDLVAKAVADGQPALGITDHGNMYGVLEFFKECRAQGVKPVIGTEAYMAYETRSERPPRRGRVDDSGGDTEGGKKLYYHLTLLAETDQGYRNLISSPAWRSWRATTTSRMDWELLARYHEGLIAPPDAWAGTCRDRCCKVTRRSAQQRRPSAGDLRQGQPVRRVAGSRVAGAARRRSSSRSPARSAPLIATSDSHYVHREITNRTMRCCACRPVRRSVTRSGSSSRPGALPQDIGRDALPVPGLSRGVRQHALGRRAADVNIEFSSRSFQLSDPRRFADDAGYLDHRVGRCQGALGR
jgi:hypothetical protein